jgi:hypothetical protein
MRSETERNEAFKRSVAIVTVAAITLGAVLPLSAAPIVSNTDGVKAALSNPLTDVRYSRRGYHRGYGYGYAVPAIAGGLAVGIIGAATGQGYYGPGYGPAYGPGYRPGYQPGYYGNPNGYNAY